MSFNASCPPLPDDTPERQALLPVLSVALKCLKSNGCEASVFEGIEHTGKGEEGRRVAVKVPRSTLTSSGSTAFTIPKVYIYIRWQHLFVVSDHSPGLYSRNINLELSSAQEYRSCFRIDTCRLYTIAGLGMDGQWNRDSVSEGSESYS